VDGAVEIPDWRVTTAAQTWDQATVALQQQLSQATWNTWFREVHAVELEGDTLRLATPNGVVCERIRSNYRGLIAAVVQEITGDDIIIDLTVEHGPRVDEPVLVLPGTSGNGSGTSAEAIAPAALATTPVDTGPSPTALNPRYTFEHFVIGASNRFAHAAALAVAEAPARSYNPLFIYGPAGLGKTHLLHAIGNYAQEVHQLGRIRYVSTETLMNEFVDAIRNNAANSFRRRYREVDLLLVDDIQFLERSQQLQEEFFHTFNSLHGAGGQIVLSSDRPPKQIPRLEDRLRTRLEWGLITDIQPPEFETRLAILRMKAESERLENIPDEVLAFIASNISDNVRELEGALIRIAAYSSLHRTTLDETVAKAVLGDLLPPSKPRVVTPELILDETAEMFGFTVEDLCGKSRRRPLVIARQIGMYVFRELTDFSYPRIAEQFGGRDHTTVIHAVEKIKALMTERHQVFDQVNELMSRVRLGTGG
jgi:chromosomal replication initiator protein